MTHYNASGHLKPYDGKRGRVWYAALRLPDGSQKKVKLGKDWTEKGRPPAGYLTKKMAVAKTRELVVDADKGHIQRTSEVTFAQIAREWLDYIEFDRKRKHSTVFHYRFVTNKHLIPRWGAKRADKVTTAEVNAYRLQLLEEGMSASTINKRLMYISAMYKLASKPDRHGLRKNPADSVERQPDHASGHIDVYTPAEVKKVSAAAEGWYSNLVTFAAFTGLRLSELRDLHWADLDLSKRLVHIRTAFVLGEVDTPKSHKVRSVPLVDQAIEAIESQRETVEATGPDDLVFPNEIGTQFDDSTARKAYKKAIKAAGLKPIRFHDLRHTFGTLAVQVFPITDVMGYMGHADLSTTMIYVHHKSRKGDAAALSAYIAEQAARDEDEGEDA